MKARTAKKMNQKQLGTLIRKLLLTMSQDAPTWRIEPTADVNRAATLALVQIYSKYTLDGVRDCYHCAATETRSQVDTVNSHPGLEEIVQDGRSGCLGAQS
ncbi:hypothetical protein P3T76_016144 [Phytophthora citrophthora]|uniref:Uncharacterized protein n=1 Tax=Phytophthora citrophthora TaxID=4793 RepID=A0AAD9L9M0_9STRA|nr:hypothetical protein P3T76_016144 [Phytophthora citrophthora]